MKEFYFEHYLNFNLPLTALRQNLAVNFNQNADVVVMYKDSGKRHVTELLLLLLLLRQNLPSRKFQPKCRF
jgi:hypothetical protein